MLARSSHSPCRVNCYYRGRNSIDDIGEIDGRHFLSMEFIKGEDNLTLYQFNTGTAKHYFCKRCGVYVFHRKRAAPDPIVLVYLYALPLFGGVALYLAGEGLALEGVTATLARAIAASRAMSAANQARLRKTLEAFEGGE